MSCRQRKVSNHEAYHFISTGVPFGSNSSSSPSQQAIERQLQERIITAIRTSIACSRISGFVRVESAPDNLFDVPLTYIDLPMDSALTHLSPSFLDAYNGASAASSRTASPASSSATLGASKVSRRKAYQPRRIPEPIEIEAEPEAEPMSLLDPRTLQASVSEAMAPSLAVFPTATPEYVSAPPPPPLQPAIGLASEPLRSLLPKPPGRQRNRAFRPKTTGGSKRSPNKEFTCNQCGDKFRSLNSLTEHTTAVHQWFRCTTCNAKFTQRSNLQRHSLKHLGFKPFKCAICRKEYYRKDHLVRHVEVSHPGSDPKGSIVNVLPSAECLRLAEVEKKLKEAAAAVATNEAAVDLSLGRPQQEEEGSAPSSEPILEEEEEEEDERVSREEEEMEEEEEEEEELAPTDLSLGAPLLPGSFFLPMPSVARKL